MDQKKIGAFIAQCRKEKSLTQIQLAELLDITNQAVSKWENGKNLPDMTMPGSIAEILQASCDELLNPEKTLERLANPEPQKGETEETDMKGYTFLNVE